MGYAHRRIETGQATRFRLLLVDLPPLPLGEELVENVRSTEEAHTQEWRDKLVADKAAREADDAANSLIAEEVADLVKLAATALSAVEVITEVLHTVPQLSRALDELPESKKKQVQRAAQYAGDVRARKPKVDED